MGRHSLYTPEIAETIIEGLENGESLRSICLAPGMPSKRSVLRWNRDNVEGFSHRYARARELGYQLMADDIIDISDDSVRDYKTTADGKEIPDAEVVARSRLRVDSRKWLLSKMLPKIYGDKLALEHSGEVATKDMPGEQLESRIADLIRKSGAFGAPGGEEPPGD